MCKPLSTISSTPLSRLQILFTYRLIQNHQGTTKLFRIWSQLLLSSCRFYFRWFWHINVQNTSQDVTCLHSFTLLLIMLGMPPLFLILQALFLQSYLRLSSHRTPCCWTPGTCMGIISWRTNFINWLVLGVSGVSTMLQVPWRTRSTVLWIC